MAGYGQRFRLVVWTVKNFEKYYRVLYRPIGQKPKQNLSSGVAEGHVGIIVAAFPNRS
jgi:hypothetical protein